MRIDFSRGFMSYAADKGESVGAKLPKGETLEQHLKHCRAKDPASCPFVKSRADETGREDGVSPEGCASKYLPDNAEEMAAGDVLEQTAENIAAELGAEFETGGCEENAPLVFQMACEFSSAEKNEMFLKTAETEFQKLGWKMESKSIGKYAILSFTPSEEPLGEAGGGGGKPTQGTPGLPGGVKEAHAAILKAVKSINHHIDIGDFNPNPASLSGMQKAAAWVKEQCQNGGENVESDLKALYDTMCEVAESAKSGWKKKIGMMKPLASGWKPGGEHPPKAAMEHMMETLLHKHKSSPSGQPKEAPDAHEYDPSAWSHLASGRGAGYLKELADGYADNHNALDSAIGICFGTAHNDVPPGMSGACKGHCPLADKQMTKDTLTCTAATMWDLKDRFPKIKMPHIDLLFVSKPKSPFVGAEFTRQPDGKTAICFHADYGHVSHGGSYSYGHPDSRLPFDVLRHELAHAIGKGEIHKEWKKFIGETYGFPAKGFFKVMKEKVSDYAAVFKPGMKTPDIYEALAETFSMITSHDYKPGTLPRPIEDFVYTRMLGEQKKGK